MADIRQTFGGKNLFCTGVTGFLGKVLLFKVLKEFPDVGTVYCLCRPKKNVPMQQRFEKEVLSSPCFDPLIKQIGPEEWNRRKSKCVPVAGDITFHRLGLSAEDYATLTKRVHIIIHLAATVDFQEKLNASVNMNVLGSVRVLALAQRCEHLEALVHTSTCYVNFPRHDPAPIMEQLYPVDYDPEAMAKFIMALHDKQIPQETAKLLTRYGYPNTYTFTKNLAEHIIVKRRGNVPLAIVRPAIVGAAWREPVQGWVDALTAAGGIFLTVGLGVCHDLVGDLSNSPDIIPVDHVVNVLLKVAHRTSLQHKASQEAIAHATTAQRGPVGKEVALAPAALKPSAPPQALDIAAPAAAIANPLLVTARDGSSDTAFDADVANPVRIYQAATSGTMNPCIWRTIELSLIPYWREMKHPKAASPPYFTFHKTLLSFEAAFFFKHRLPLAVMQTINRLPGIHDAKRAQMYSRYEKALARTRDLNMQFAPFTINQWKFDCTNADSLDGFLAPENKAAFAHDVFDINWFHYGVAYSWGLIKFIMKEDRPQPVGPPSGSEVVLKAFL